jgi:hypothetical protein
MLRQQTIAEKERLLSIAEKRNLDPDKRAEVREMAEWLTLWLQSPEVFENWLKLRLKTPDFVSTFGEI